jgi:hypothetical protein
MTDIFIAAITIGFQIANKKMYRALTALGASEIS